jgi:hypothetical protein
MLAGEGDSPIVGSSAVTPRVNTRYETSDRDSWSKTGSIFSHEAKQATSRFYQSGPDELKQILQALGGFHSESTVWAVRPAQVDARQPQIRLIGNVGESSSQR